MRRKTALTALLVLIFIFVPIMGICETIDWKQYNEGIRLAKKENKKVFLHFRTGWCGYCKQMELITFKDNSVVRFLNEHFVSIKVDGDKEKSFVKAYKVKGYPDNRWLDEKIKEAYRLPGFVGPETFLFFLEYIQTDSYKTMDPIKYYRSR
ncbi:MAG: DUF255 domain-containing protein [Deltaproteobacteria bacterium]|nr:DUF255 domain-containing protein [Deltaproteobacteria bacterium]